MKKIRINNFEEQLIYEKLDNGLEIYLVPVVTKKNYMALMGVKYGGADTCFKIDGKVFSTPSGIAHFLEHKLFEQDESPFKFYSKSGTDVNASTTQDYTSYYFSGNNNFEDNLDYLLKWVTKFHVNEEQVEKEQGIILEESNMYKDNPDRILFEKLNENVFINHPYRIKTIGIDDDILRITKDDLELCYNSFYQPNNMFFIAVGCFDYEKTLDIIKRNMGDIKNSNSKIEKMKIDEPDQVNKKSEILEGNVQISKLGVSYKISKKNFDDLDIDKYFLDLYLYMSLALGFGTTSDFRDDLLKEELITSFGYQLSDTDDHYIIDFIATSNKPNILYEKIDDYIKKIVFEEKDFERMKKTWIASEVRMIDNVSITTYNILDDILDYNEYKSQKIEDKKGMNYQDFLNIYKMIDFSNKTYVILNSKG